MMKKQWTDWDREGRRGDSLFREPPNQGSIKGWLLILLRANIFIERG